MSTLALRRLVILSIAGSALGGTIPAVAADGFERISDLVYHQANDEELKADAYVPRGDGPHPAVLVVHGGAWRAGNKSQLARVAELLAGRGYTAMAINYRLAPKHKFPAQIEDCRAAVKYLRDNAAKLKVDTKRVGAFGYSAGGHLSALLGTESKDETLKLQAVCCGGAPCDFRKTPNFLPTLSYWLGGTRGENPNIYEQASPAAFVSKDNCPMFFFHGADDSLVRLNQPEGMVEALKAVSVPAELYVVPDAGHIQAARDSKAIGQAAAFFDQHLRGETQSPPQP